MSYMNIAKGTDTVFSYTYYDDDGDTVDISSGYTITLSVYRELNTGSTIFTETAASLGSDGTFTITVQGTNTTSLTKDYYPYKIIINDGSIDTLYELGILNINDTTDRWSWEITKLDGATLSDLRTQVNRYLRYSDWTDVKINQWINDSIQDFCEQTGYMKAYLYFTSQFNRYNYFLPNEVIDIYDVSYYNSSGDWVQLERTVDWSRRDNLFSVIDMHQYTTNGRIETVESTALDKTVIEGGYTFKLYCSKYAQELSDDSDYLELPKGCEDAIVFKAVSLALIEDRNFEEADRYELKYMQKVAKYAEISEIANDRRLQLRTGEWH